MVEAHAAQSDRLRDSAWRPSRDFAPPSVASFRADRERADDARVLEAFLGLVAADGTVVDVGAGAGRFAIPLARSVSRVFAVEPSAAMGEALLEDARRSKLRNLTLVKARWEDVADVHGDLVFSAHVVYSMLEIGPFVRYLDAAALTWAAVLVFEESPLSWLHPFWPLVHDESRLPAPHLPQVVDVVSELGFGPVSVDLIDIEPFELGPPEIARQKLRRRLYVAPGSDADVRLQQAMCELLDDREGVLVPRTDRTIRVGLVRWAPSGL
jgi:SAM-dependent methyltransferase